jgi:hypothetical protein
MATSDSIQHQFIVGDIVNVPCVVASTGGTAVKPTVTLTTKYVGFDAATDSLGPIDAIQVIKDN